ncbi:hypothetical protein [Wolbachia endosymbiont of Pentidionis agamae]|uniref:hypothetical protein n=1 Tax=Wolbachia endosymbiont of Pentidionis agamae TaxID=3110435 RepID=UPI002FD64D6D
MFKLYKILLLTITVLSYTLLPYFGQADLSNQLDIENVKDHVKEKTSEFSSMLDNMGSSTIIWICIGVIAIFILFRGFIFFILILIILGIIFGVPDNIVDPLKERMNYIGQKMESLISEFGNKTTQKKIAEKNSAE